jgi:hypothetical protein
MKECENYDQTTTVESSEEEDDDIIKRKRKKKTYEDFVTGIYQILTLREISLI